LAIELPAAARHVWIAFLAVNSANAGIGWLRGRKHRQRDPSLSEGYRTLALGELFWGSIPWLVMGAGLEVGGLTPERYFDPTRGDPWVSAWFASVIGLWLVSGYWTFLRGGAEQLVRHPGFIRGEPSVAGIQLLWCAVAGSGALALAGFWFAIWR
jgi:hypothetical protein